MWENLRKKRPKQLLRAENPGLWKTWWKTWKTGSFPDGADVFHRTFSGKFSVVKNCARRFAQCRTTKQSSPRFFLRFPHFVPRFQPILPVVFSRGGPEKPAKSLSTGAKNGSFRFSTVSTPPTTTTTTFHSFILSFSFSLPEGYGDEERRRRRKRPWALPKPTKTILGKKVLEP